MIDLDDVDFEALLEKYPSGLSSTNLSNEFLKMIGIDVDYRREAISDEQFDHIHKVKRILGTLCEPRRNFDDGEFYEL